MKELRKEYARYDDIHSHTVKCGGSCTAIYLASEADAAFAQMRLEHAEEIERLKAEHSDGIRGFSVIHDQLRKQAERYEKLRRLSPAGFAIIYLGWNDGADQLDALVDQLPASGEASADEQHGRVE